MADQTARLTLLFLTLCASSAGQSTRAAPSDAAARPWFDEVSVASGVRFEHRSGRRPGRYLLPETSGSGAAIFDFDGDGRMDVLCAQSGPLAEEDLRELAASGGRRPLSRLFRNLGGMTFEDVTERAGLTTAGYAVGASAADWDADGDVDLLLLCVGDEIVYRNEGNGTFKDVTAASGLSNPTWSSHASFADFDGDGDLDVFVSNYVDWARRREIACTGGDNLPDYCGPNNYRAPAVDSVYRNEGGGRFRDVSREAGLEAAFGNGYGVLTADLDRDGRVDAYVANDGGENQLWINKGGFVFENRALAMGCALGPEGVAQAGTGVFATDVNEDGFWDVFVADLRDETDAFYVYDGERGWFDDRAAHLGLGAPSRPSSGFGCGFADFDNDGRADLYVANGAVMRPSGAPPEKDRPYGELNQLFRGEDGPKFVEVAPRGGTAAPLVHGSRGAAFGDLDDDGGIDVVVMNADAPTYVLRNVAPGRGSFAGFRLVDERGVVAVGAEAKATFGGKSRRLLLQPAQGFCSTNDPRLHVGLGGASQVDALEVRWPGGKSETFGPFKAGAYYEVRRGAETATAVAATPRAAAPAAPKAPAAPAPPERVDVGAPVAEAAPVAAPFVPAELEALPRTTREWVMKHAAAALERPASASRRRDYALSLYFNGLLRVAEPNFAALAALLPKSPLPTHYRAHCLRRCGDLAAAARLYADVVRAHPDFAPAHDEAGRLAVDRGDWESARRSFARVRDLAPDGYHGWLGLGDVALRTGDFATAYENLARADAAAPGERVVQYRLGLALRGLGRGEAAASRLSAGSGAVPWSMDDDWSGARAVFSRSVADLSSTAVHDLRTGRPEKGLKILEDLSEEHPDNLELLNNLAAAYQDAQQPQKAVRLLEKALAKEPMRDTTLVNLASLHLNLGDYPQSLEYADRALQSNPRCAPAHFNRGNALARLGRNAEAAAAYAETVRHDPRNGKVRCALASVRYSERRFEDARREAADGLELEPDYLPGWLLLVEICAAAEDAAGVERALAGASRIAPRHPAVLRAIEKHRRR